ncbi:MAG: 50S ribosomal protein L18e [Candidatus Pacearchaeota archaeon]|nr:50S ribosomal protein L18e [Candidatus Pacearchaeota archaeon]
MAKITISKTKLKERARKKTNPEIKATILAIAKNPNWLKYAKIISSPTRKHFSVNLSEIDKISSVGDTILVPGKVLSSGKLTKKIKICSFFISKQAKDKLKETKSEWSSILKEINHNTKAEGIKIIK